MSADPTTIPLSQTAVIIMDYQQIILNMHVPEAELSQFVENANHLVTQARNLNVPIIYVVVCFRNGAPDVSPFNKNFSALKAKGMLIEGQEGTKIHAGIAGSPGKDFDI